MIDNKPIWPNGAKCAVAITFDLDVDSFLHIEKPKTSHEYLCTISNCRYGPDVAVPRILETYRKFNLKQSFFVPAWCIEQYPYAVEAMVKDGHEIGHHGYIHEAQNECSREDEAYWLKRGIDVIERFCGERPRGFRAPLYHYSHNTTDLLIEEGFTYDSSMGQDDVPYLLKSKGGDGDLVELPIHWGVDDWPPYVHMPEIDYMMPVRAPSDGIKIYREEFDAMYTHGGLLIAVCHPFVSGRVSRWMEMEKLIEYMAAKGDVWFARLDEIAAHTRRNVDEGLFNPRIVELPYYDGPIEIQR